MTDISVGRSSRTRQATEQAWTMTVNNAIAPSPRNHERGFAKPKPKRETDRQKADGGGGDTMAVLVEDPATHLLKAKVNMFSPNVVGQSGTASPLPVLVTIPPATMRNSVAMATKRHSDVARYFPPELFLVFSMSQCGNSHWSLTRQIRPILRDRINQKTAVPAKLRSTAYVTTTMSRTPASAPLVSSESGSPWQTEQAHTSEAAKRQAIRRTAKVGPYDYWYS